MIPIGALSFFLTAVLFNLVKNIIVFHRFGKYAVEESFTVENIGMIQGGKDGDFIIRILNNEGGKIEIRIELKILIEEAFKAEFLQKIEKYRASDSKKVDIPFEKVLKLIKEDPSKMSYIRLNDFSTGIKFDSSGGIHSLYSFLKTKYAVISSLKTKEMLFINFYGDDIEKEIDIVIKDLEPKIIYFFAADYLI